MRKGQKIKGGGEKGREAREGKGMEDLREEEKTNRKIIRREESKWIKGF